MTFVNFYQTLQVHPNADNIVIEAAAKALLKKCHPDKGGRKTVAADVLKARDALLDTDKRQKLDAELREKTKGLIGNYQIIKKIAEGGFGEVYEARHVLLDEKVCLKHNKHISPRDTELFKQEAKSIWHLRHHALPAVKDFIELPDGSCAFVMTFIEGPTLEELVEEYEQNKKPIDPENICWIMGRVLDALRYLHYHGVVHGDVKPQNIIVQREEHTCVLVDFGLALVKPTRTSVAEGYTPMFAAPEVFSGRPLLPESDLYSLGLTMIYAMGGDPSKRHMPASIPKEVRDFVGELVIYDVKNRPHWRKVDLVHKLAEVRKKAFGREHTNFKKV